MHQHEPLKNKARLRPIQPTMPAQPASNNSTPLHTTDMALPTQPNVCVEIVTPKQPIKRSTSAAKLTESKSLEVETKGFLGRVGVTCVARRCAHYTPTLKELSTTSFSDYVRGEVLGVPLPGYEFLYVYEDKKDVAAPPVTSATTTPPSCNTPPLAAETKVGTTTNHAQQEALQSAASARSATPSNPSPAAPTTATKQEPQRSMHTRSRSQAIGSAKKDPIVLSAPKHSVPEPKKYKMCWYKLRDGIAKVSLPQGFWAKMDSTARGRHVSLSLELLYLMICKSCSLGTNINTILSLLFKWAKGSKLGDMTIPSPIKQCLSGIGGVSYRSLHTHLQTCFVS